VTPPLYQFRVEDMEDDHVLLLECACGHRGYLTKRELLKSPRIHSYDRVIGLAFVLRCRLCRKRGRAEIKVNRLAPH
jgi:hypothetical protein